MVQNRELTRRIAGLPLTDKDCDIAEGIAARILAKHFTTESPMLDPHEKVETEQPCPFCGEQEIGYSAYTSCCYCAHCRATSGPANPQLASAEDRRHTAVLIWETRR